MLHERKLQIVQHIISLKIIIHASFWAERFPFLCFIYSACYSTLSVLKNLSEKSNFLFSLLSYLGTCYCCPWYGKLSKKCVTTWDYQSVLWSIHTSDAVYKMPDFLSNLVFTPRCFVSVINENRYPHETVRYA